MVTVTVRNGNADPCLGRYYLVRNRNIDAYLRTYEVYRKKQEWRPRLGFLIGEWVFFTLNQYIRLQKFVAVDVDADVDVGIDVCRCCWC